MVSVRKDESEGGRLAGGRQMSGCPGIGLVQGAGECLAAGEGRWLIAMAARSVFWHG